MAAVYAATHRNGKRVAVKILHSEYARNDEAQTRFIEEGYLANRVGHPGVVSILDDDVTEDGAAFLVMDLLEGETLEERIGREGPLGPLDVLELSDRLLDVLGAAHAASIVHRDIKPNNIFLGRDGRVRLLDFGIARLNLPGRPRTTQFGMAVGTPAFMPPEQARGRAEEIDGRSDLWALGATMFMALTGRQVHEGETTNEELLAAMTRSAPSLATVAPRLPKELSELVDRALAFERDQRWESAAAMQQAVREVSALVSAQSSGVRARESFVAFEDFTPPVPAGRPMTLMRARALGLRPRSEAPASLPPSPRRTRGRVAGLVVAGLVLVTVVGVQVRREQRARQAAAASMAPAKPETPAVEVATSRPNDIGDPPGNTPVAEAPSPPPVTPTAAPEERSRRGEGVRNVPPHGKNPARRAQPAPARPASNVSGTETPAAPPPSEPAAPADPLDRRR
jgi:serine/threonine-protein kinase